MINKLYKYIIFDIKAEYKSKIWTITGGSQWKLWLQRTKDNEQVELESCGNFQNIKLILRPFDDLIKEIPLTKSAAQMLDMEEAELIFPFSAYITYLARKENYATIIRKFHPLYKSNSVKIINGDIYDSLGNKIINKNLESSRCIYKPLTYDKGLNFLRAMHFAIDFEENEYIKLE